MTVAERVAPAAYQTRTRLFKYGLYELRPLSDAEQIQTFKFDWEREHLEGSKDLVFRNSSRISVCAGNLLRKRYQI